MSEDTLTLLQSKTMGKVELDETMAGMFTAFNPYVKRLTWHQAIDFVNKVTPNKKRTDYKNHAIASLESRRILTEQLAEVLRDRFADRQPARYGIKQPDKPGYIPIYKDVKALEMVTDYFLADDHVKGLSIKLTPQAIPDEQEYYPDAGEGAREYEELIEMGAKLIASVIVKKCEVCERPFIDDSRAKNKLVCGESCRKRKDKLRKREEYTGGDNRLKRDRERQDYDYPFYNPKEMNEIVRFGERSSGDSLKVGKMLDRKAYRQTRGGYKKPTFIGNEKGEYSGHKYSPNQWKKWRVNEEPGELETYNMFEVSAEHVKQREWITYKNSSLYLGEICI